MTKSNANKIKFVKFPTGIPLRKKTDRDYNDITIAGERQDQEKLHGLRVEMKYELNDLIDYLSPTEVERSLRIFSIKRIENAIKEKFVGSEVFVFGSYRYGCYLPT
ncbi:19526_t:CDS:2, partial [Entrophospora sp. SA101]